MVIKRKFFQALAIYNYYGGVTHLFYFAITIKIL